MSKTQDLYNQLEAISMAELEGLVIQAFKKDKRLTDFVCAMGSVTFLAGNYDDVDDTGTNKYPATKPVFEFLDKWDSVLKLSGAGVWLKRDGTKLTKW